MKSIDRRRDGELPVGEKLDEHVAEQVLVRLGDPHRLRGAQARREVGEPHQRGRRDVPAGQQQRSPAARRQD